MAFPTNPSLGEEHIVNSVTYVYNGAAWDIDAVMPSNSSQLLDDVIDALTISGNTITLARGDNSVDEITTTNAPITLSGDVSGSGTNSIDVSVVAATNIVLTGEVTEDVFSLVGTVLNPSNGTIQYKTLSSNATLTDALSAGHSITLRIVNGDTYDIIWPTISWIGVDEPTLTANCQVVIWKESSILYGMYCGSFV